VQNNDRKKKNSLFTFRKKERIILYRKKFNYHVLHLLTILTDLNNDADKSIKKDELIKKKIELEDFSN